MNLLNHDNVHTDKRLQEIVDIPPVATWPKTATAIHLFYGNMDARFICSIGRVITRDEAAHKEAEG